MKPYKENARLLRMMSCLMLLFIVWQVAFLAIHYQAADIFQSIAGTSISHDLLHISILLPILVNILIQIICYVLIVIISWLIAISIGDTFHLSTTLRYWLGIFCLTLAMADLLALNSYYFPFSFFAFWSSHYFLLVSALFWFGVSAMAFRRIGWILLGLIAINGLALVPSLRHTSSNITSQPNIILIGLDSLRPDFTGFYGKQDIHTPTIDDFLRQSTAFSQAYTPLARTFPAWVSILTAQHPKHNGARNNLADATTIVTQDTLARHLQHAGYYTLYASDEKRFSNITPSFGFDQVAGPGMGINDFILGSLTDFPVTNLLTKLPIAKFILPYNFANRAAIVTYQPEQMLTLISNALTQRPDKPLFLAVHLCLAHWPYNWASSSDKNEIQPRQYQHSVEAIDKQLGGLLDILKQRGVLENSIVVLLSDHGTTLGLPHDTVLDKKYYLGKAAYLKNVPVSKLSTISPDSVDFKHAYTINTTYGQGTNVASIKQYNTVLAFKRYGEKTFPAQRITTPVSLTDIAPTLLALLNLPSLKHSDGISLVANLQHGNSPQKSPRAFFIETGDSLSEIETDHIFLEKVLAKKVGLYRVDPQTALLILDPIAEIAIIKTKQRAIISGDWLLARYPLSTQERLVPDSKNSSHLTIKPVTVPAYYVLVNLKTGRWTIGLNSSFAKTAPVAELSKKLHEFYGDEMS